MPRNFVPDHIIDKLINLVRQNPAIYDPSRKDHKDAIKISNTWFSIVELLNWEQKTGDFWKIRWRTLRDTYMRKKREIKMKPSGSGANNDKKWKFQDVLQFLEPYTEEQKSSSNLENESMSNVTDVLEIDVGDDSYNDSQASLEDKDDSSLKSKNTSEKKSTESTTSGGMKKRSYNAIDKAFLDFCEDAKKRREISLERDEDEAFLEPYVYRLKNMSADVKGVVQLQIAQIFFNAENRHLPPQPIMPLPPLTHQMQPYGAQVEFRSECCQQQQQTDCNYSENHDILASAMEQLY